MPAPVQNKSQMPKPRSLTPMTKTEFLEAFVYGIWFVKGEYIKQEVFYGNTSRLLCASFKNAKILPNDVQSVKESIVKTSFVSYVKGTTVDTWGMIRDNAAVKRDLDYINGLKREFDAYKNAAVFDSMDLLVGAGLGKMIKGGVKVAKAACVKNGQIAAASYGRKGAVAEVNLRISLDGNRNLGRCVNNIGVNKITGERSIRNIGKDKFSDKRYAKRFVDVSVNTNDMIVSSAINLSENYVKNDIAFSYGNLMGNGMDVATDFIPFVGNAKALVSTAANAKFAIDSYNSIKMAWQSHLELIERQKQFFKNNFLARMEKDIMSFDKTKLYRMYMHLKNEKII